MIEPGKPTSGVNLDPDTEGGAWDAFSTAVLTAVVPKFSVASLIAAYFDAAALQQEVDLGGIAVIDQVGESVALYRFTSVAARDAAYANARAAVPEVAEFSRAEIPASSALRQFGE
jgi:hypothetical protein